MKTHAAHLEQFKSKEELMNIKYYQELYLKGSKKRAPKKIEASKPHVVKNFEYLPIMKTTINPKTDKVQNYKPLYGNYTNQINDRFPPLEEFEGNETIRRMGTLGIKLGMTTLYDNWGDIVPVTIVLLDRVQVVQIKKPESGNKFYQVQMGIGDKKIKKLTKAELGHYLKAKVPPKKVLT